jgi:hypothetical protein
MMRSFDYARTGPEPPEGALVFAVRLVVEVMARAYAGDFGRRQLGCGRILRSGKEVETGIGVTP